MMGKCVNKFTLNTHKYEDLRSFWLAFSLNKRSNQQKLEIMSKQGGRDLERVRQQKAAPSHTGETHKIETEKNKKVEADLKAKGKDQKHK